ncbi:site-specific integrase [uncultured Oceanisphaera sp.]|uniref:site-specific integrase n=1 Tax=uncultured Oceanisphaera sp. TaxID=353858 RepID=UPI00263832B3|nr:site-specific integrase [uncultured Oceanisphaera sp.]
MILDVPPRLPDKPVRFMDQLRSLIRSRNLAYKTEQTYCHWIKRFIRFHGMRHSSTCSTTEVEQFLSHLAVQRNNSVSTQRTALNAIVFLFCGLLARYRPSLAGDLASPPSL